MKINKNLCSIAPPSINMINKIKDKMRSIYVFQFLVQIGVSFEKNNFFLY